MLACCIVSGSLKPSSQSLVLFFFQIFILHLDTNEGLFFGCTDVFYSHEDLPFILALLILFLTRGSRLLIFVLTIYYYFFPLFCSFEFGLYVRLFVGSSLSVYSGGPGLRIDFLS